MAAVVFAIATIRGIEERIIHSFKFKTISQHR